MPVGLPPPKNAVATPRPDQPPASWGERLVVLVLRLATIALGSWILLQLPLPILDAWLPLRNVAIVIGAIILTGKVLFDTFFFERFWP